MQSDWLPRSVLLEIVDAHNDRPGVWWQSNTAGQSESFIHTKLWGGPWGENPKREILPYLTLAEVWFIFENFM